MAGFDERIRRGGGVRRPDRPLPRHCRPGAGAGTVIGTWQRKHEYGITSEQAVGVLAGAAGRLPALRALFLGDITPEVQEISWITQSDVTPLLTAFPQLEEFGVKGGEGLGLSPVTHPNLRRLSILSGGLGREVVRAVGASTLPALRTLELCLGDPEYGGNSTVADLAGILSGERLPALRRLALADAAEADQIAAELAHAPVVARLEELDLSLGTFGDQGAAALLAGQPLDHLSTLELNYNFLTEPVAAQLVAALPTVAVNVDPEDAEVDEEYEDYEDDEEYLADGEDRGSGGRYVAIAE